ncbi:hypothetical protein A9Q84_16175 [Halobacteriovorax marinus]|uniref:Uncharacterized protein n=1 Tax=Halobacteriovorax marinus TaxID=97084 RepID=A0A1Y5FAP3_9BACT|nr:hypothetical protein A9Q84_16175 [Halobacteriovorax marinus]
MSILITGSHSDVARALMIKLVEDGEEVILTCSSKESLKSTSEYLVENSLEGKVSLVEYNLTKSADTIQNITELIKDKKVHALVLNAWIKVEKLKLFEDIDEVELDEELNGNLKGNMKLLTTLLPHMKENKMGRILFISSIGAISGASKYGLYCMGKAAMEGLMLNLAVDYGKYNITANTLRPGITKTERTRRFWEREYYQKRMSAGIPLGKLGEPEQVAKACLPFLDRESYITGAALNVSGGLPLMDTASAIKKGKEES